MSLSSVFHIVHSPFNFPIIICRFYPLFQSRKEFPTAYLTKAMAEWKTRSAIAWPQFTATISVHMNTLYTQRVSRFCDIRVHSLSIKRLCLKCPPSFKSLLKSLQKSLRISTIPQTTVWNGNSQCYLFYAYIVLSMHIMLMHWLFSG